MAALTLEERLDTVLHGGIPDRVPCIPLVYYFAAHFTGTPFRDFMSSMTVYRRAMDSLFWDIGPWDAMYPLPVTMDAPDFYITYGAGVGMKPSLPEGGDADARVVQLRESETLMDEGWYFDIIEGRRRSVLPLIDFMSAMVARLDGREPGQAFTLGHFLPRAARLAARWVTELGRWRVRGVPFFSTFGLEAPFDTFSMARGVQGFSRDIHRRPDEVSEASMVLARSITPFARLACEATRCRRFLLLLHRSSNDFISPQQFGELALPSLSYIAGYLSARGIVFGMHCDGNWDGNLEAMTVLPENTFFQFDGMTDISRARDVLGDRFTIMGDVPPAMLSLAGPAEVAEYCRGLISSVGKDGRFILSSGCEVPPNAKPECVKAMIDAAKTLGRY